MYFNYFLKLLVGKKGFDKMTKHIPSKQIELKDQYEFTESTEENSVGYQTSNTLCYMPRVKEDSRSEDSKDKLTFAQVITNLLVKKTVNKINALQY